MSAGKALERDVIGCAPFVRVEGGYLPLEPAVKPDSSLRFHRPTMPSGGDFDVVSAGTTRRSGLGSPRSVRKQTARPGTRAPIRAADAARRSR